MVASVADRASHRPKTVASQTDFPSPAATSLSAVLAAGRASAVGGTSVGRVRKGVREPGVN